MDHAIEDLRLQYPIFIYESFSWKIQDSQLVLVFKYSAPRSPDSSPGPSHQFTHQLVYENLDFADTSFLDTFVFHLGLAAMPSYWKATCSPVIEIRAGYLDESYLPFWKKIFEKGMGEYYFKNRIDFTAPNFLTIKNACIQQQPTVSAQRPVPSGKVLIPIGGGKDSAVTAEILKEHFSINCIVVNPIPASIDTAKIAGVSNPIIVRRTIDPYLLKLNSEGYLNGHVPFSSSVAFISALAAAISGYRYIALSNERSSNEGNAEYLGTTVNHQYSKTLEFETDFNAYIHQLSSALQLADISYFSFLRPLYELQIGRLFSAMPQYFPVFRSCNSNFKQAKINDPANTPKLAKAGEGWCGHCSKCLSIALVLSPWLDEDVIVSIFGRNPLIDPSNKALLKNMITPGKKPFECVTTTAEAKLALEIIRSGFVPQSGSLLQEWLDNPNMPPEFSHLLKQEYDSRTTQIS